MNIQTRKDLTNYFQTCLVKSSKEGLQISEEEELPSKSLKSYIIESNILLKKISLENFKINILDTKDNTLKVLDISNKDNEKIKFFADLFDSRFFIFHSFDDKNLTDNFISKLINQRASNFDFPWFSNSFMDKVSGIGTNDSFTVKFKDEFLINKEESLDIGKFSMRFWGNKGRERFNEIKNKTTLRTGTSLSNVGIRLGNSHSFIKDNISFSGKLTAVQGNSIGEHFFVVNKLKSLYSELITKIESYSLDYKIQDNKIKIEGEPIIIEFDKEIEDLEYFIKILVSSKIPFRIWGLPEFIDEDYVTVNGIDLHTGDKINFEASKKWLRIYLPKGSCGNIITRLLTNIQHHFDSNAKLIIDRGEIN